MICMLGFSSQQGKVCSPFPIEKDWQPRTLWLLGAVAATTAAFHSAWPTEVGKEATHGKWLTEILWFCMEFLWNIWDYIWDIWWIDNTHQICGNIWWNSNILQHVDKFYLCEFWKRLWLWIVPCKVHVVFGTWIWCSSRECWICILHLAFTNKEPFEGPIWRHSQSQSNLRPSAHRIPSGKLSYIMAYRKSPCLMGKSTINGPCSITTLNYQRIQLLQYPVCFATFATAWSAANHMRSLHNWLGKGSRYIICTPINLPL